MKSAKSVANFKMQNAELRMQAKDRRLQFFLNPQLTISNPPLSTTLKKKLIKPIQPLTNLNFATRIN